MPTPRRAAGPRALAPLAPAILLVALASCASKETFGPPPAKTSAKASADLERRAEQAAVDHDAWASLGYRLDWRGFPPVGKNQHIISVDADDQVVIVQESGSILSVLETDTGRLRWSSELANPLTRFVGNLRTADQIYASAESELHVLNLDTGALVDRQTYASVVNTRPIPFADLLVYGTAAGQLTGHLTTFGVEAWAYASTGSVNVNPVRIGNAVGAVTQSGEVIFIHGPTGSLLGRATLFDGAVTDPAASDSLMYIASLDQSVYAISPDGTIAWRYRTAYPLRYRPVFHNNTLFVAIPDEGLVALDANTGAVKWKTPDIRGHAVAQRGRNLIVWEPERQQARAIRASDGTIEQTIALPATQDLVAPSFADGALYAVAANGVLARFIPRN